MTAAVLWYTPAARFSKSDAITTTFVLARHDAQALGRGSGDGLGEVEEARVLLAAEILRAEEFLQANDLRAFPGGVADASLGLG